MYRFHNRYRLWRMVFALLTIMVTLSAAVLLTVLYNLKTLLQVAMSTAWVCWRILVENWDDKAHH